MTFAKYPSVHEDTAALGGWARDRNVAVSGAAGWTIVGDETGTRFTNDRTGHGMFVSIDEVSTY